MKTIMVFLALLWMPLSHADIAIVKDPCVGRGPAGASGDELIPNVSLAGFIMGNWFALTNDDPSSAASTWLEESSSRTGYKTNKDFISEFYKPHRATSHCTLFLYIYDEISMADVATLEGILKQFANPPFLHVTLNSYGGSVEAGIALGEIVRSHYGVVTVNPYNAGTVASAVGVTLFANRHLDNIEEEFQLARKNIDRDLLAHGKRIVDATEYENGTLKNVVDGVCYSACVLVYAGGIARLATEGAKIGVHQHFLGQKQLQDLSVEDGIQVLKDTTREISEYLASLGVNPDLLNMALSTNKDQIRVLNLCELKDLLPFAVAEYSAVIPDKHEQHLRSLRRSATSYFYRINRSSNPMTLEDIIESAYQSLEDENPDVRWAAFYVYGLERGIEFQKRDWTKSASCT